jgi:hypothetical protein
LSRKEVAINFSGGSFLFTLLLISVQAGLLNIPGFQQTFIQTRPTHSGTGGFVKHTWI